MLVKATIPVFLLPTIVAFYVQSFVCVPSLSSRLLLRIYPNTFAFIPIPPMSLSSRNRSNSKAFCHILPCVAPVCEDMHYHKTGVPWQMNNTLIIKFSCSHLAIAHCHDLHQIATYASIVVISRKYPVMPIFALVYRFWWHCIFPINDYTFRKTLQNAAIGGQYVVVKS